MDRKSIHLLGHIVDKHGLHVDMTKVDAMSKMPAPTDATGVKCFLGSAGYYRNFVTDFGSRTSYLTNLLKKTVPFKWTTDFQSEFDDIKKALVSAPVLALPRWDLPFVLRCNASEHWPWVCTRADPRRCLQNCLLHFQKVHTS